MTTNTQFLTNTTYDFKAGVKYKLEFTSQTSYTADVNTIFELRMRIASSVVGAARITQTQNPSTFYATFTPTADGTQSINMLAVRVIGTGLAFSEVPKILVTPLYN